MTPPSAAVATNTHTPDPPTALEYEVALEDFLAAWEHCDLSANFLAFALSRGVPEADQCEYIISTVINELLEVAFLAYAEGDRAPPPGGRLQLRAHFLRDGDTPHGHEGPSPVAALEFHLTLPSVGASPRVFAEVAAALSGEPADRVYRRQLAGAPPTAHLGLYEIAANYGVGFAADHAPGDVPSGTGDGSERVRVRLPLCSALAS